MFCSLNGKSKIRLKWLRTYELSRAMCTSPRTDSRERNWYFTETSTVFFHSFLLFLRGNHTWAIRFLGLLHNVFSPSAIIGLVIIDDWWLVIGGMVKVRIAGCQEPSEKLRRDKERIYRLNPQRPESTIKYTGKYTAVKRKISCRKIIHKMKHGSSGWPTDTKLWFLVPSGKLT